jgi:hypothetical protein
VVGETLSLNKPCGSRQKRSLSLSEDVKQTVIDFFHQYGISRQAPGMRDVHKQFKHDFPGMTIGKSKFAQLRPPHIDLERDTPHNVCVCAVHYNFLRYLK